MSKKPSFSWTFSNESTSERCSGQRKREQKASSNAGQSGPFIDFMLNEIYKTLKSHQGEPVQDIVPNKVPDKVPNKLKYEFPDIADAAWNVLMALKTNHTSTSEEIGMVLGISSRMVRKHIATLREAGLIVRVGSNKTGYWKVTIDSQESPFDNSNLLFLFAIELKIASILFYII